MGLPWVRFDTQFPSNPKVLCLAEDKKWRAIAVYVCSLAYAGAHGTDGFIPKTALSFIHSTSKESKELIEAGLWDPLDGGWEINDWIAHQQSSEESMARSQRAKMAAHKRWHGGDPK